MHLNSPLLALFLEDFPVVLEPDLDSLEQVYQNTSNGVELYCVQHERVLYQSTRYHPHLPG